MSNFLGLDYGSKRIGVAIGDDETKIARPLMTVKNDANLFANLRDLIQVHTPTALVVGQPRGLEGQTTAQTKQVLDFVRQAQAVVDCPVVPQDEALTSELARERYPQVDVDQAAAAIILQDYLDGL